MTENHFQHRQSAHCESGVVASLLSHGGLPISEPMAFGLASALSFAYIPFIKLSGMPLIAYRMPPRSILKNIEKRLGVTMRFQTFRNPAKGMAALDAALAQGQLVGLQTSVYWLPYMPEHMRFHFNAHNLLVYGKDGDDYLISDPIFEQPMRCPAPALEKARFAKGALAARGLMYQATEVPTQFDLEKVARQAIAANFRIMAKAPLPVIGIRGIRYLGRNIRKLHRDPKRRDHYLPLYLNHIIRMQEEIGTGGAGFRFIYGSFLRETAKALNNPLLAEAAHQITDAGDEWRMFALLSSKMSKGRMAMDAPRLEQQLNLVADKEAQTWQLLKNF